MALVSSPPESGFSGELHIVRELDGCDVSTSGRHMPSQFKRRKTDTCSHSYQIVRNMGTPLPLLCSSDYFTKPTLRELAAREVVETNYCTRVPDFTVGRVGYGYVKFLGATDVRRLELDKIVRFNRHEIVVYPEESNKPPIGQGLNKAAEVTLILQTKLPISDKYKADGIMRILRNRTEKQGATFVTFNSSNGEWKFLVDHFSRFGLAEEDDDDVVMDDAVVEQPLGPNKVDETDVDDEPILDPTDTVLSHSLPAHLGLDPIKMQEMRMLMFPAEEDEDFDYSGREYMRTDGNPSRKNLHRQNSSFKANHSSGYSAPRKSPQALLEYVSGSELGPPRNILMTGQNKSFSTKTTKANGFQLDLKRETPITNSHSNNIVDAALFMGRSFRVGWGPNGVLVHTGMPIGNTGLRYGLSSTIHIEKALMNKAVKDENNVTKEELIDSCFVSPLLFHKSLNHETMDISVGSFRLKLQKLVCSRLILPAISKEYIGIIERLLDYSGLSSYTCVYSLHQVMIWELIKVLFSEREITSQSKSLDLHVDEDDGEYMMDDKKDGLANLDPDAYHLVRKAEFSYWLQESFGHRVQEEASSINQSNYLEHIFLLLTGRQLDAAVELAASKADVRMACLLAQAGGSMLNRSDMAQQLEIWRINGLDFRFIENERLKLYELLAGNIQGALSGSKIDWKRFLGLLMWYQLSPTTNLPTVIHTYRLLLAEGLAPFPIPGYVDEGPPEGVPKWSPGDRYDLAYYLMLLHAEEAKAYMFIKTMFSAFASTHDPLDYHMIWHQKAILEAIGAFTTNDLHVLDMSYISQLLCLGQCHWAIYVVLHMPHSDDFPYIQAAIIREILFQYCESWSRDETQRKFIESLGVPPEWLHESLAIYFQYNGDLAEALEHFLQCSNWQKAHSIFMTSVAHTLFSLSKHSEIWRLATTMEKHKSEIADWALGAGIYIDFYILKSSLQEDTTLSELDSLGKKTESCRHFFDSLYKSLSIWGSKFTVEARATYSKMAAELCDLLMPGGAQDSTREAQLNCLDAMLTAPIAEDRRSCHLQDAVSVFTFLILETTP